MYLSAGGSFAEHWVDVIVAALLAALGYFITDRLRTVDARNEHAEKKIEGLCDRVAKLEGQVNGRIFRK